jgi:hypothetical protein
LVFPVWVLLLCVILYTRVRAIPAEAVVSKGSPPSPEATRISHDD